MTEFRPTYITFDCYGTLIDFQMSHLTGSVRTDATMMRLVCETPRREVMRSSSGASGGRIAPEE